MPGVLTCECLTCPKCRARLRENERRRLHAYGTYDNGFVDPARAVAHVQHLRDLGIGRDAIAAAAGVAPTTVERMHLRKRIKRDIEAKVLAVTGPTTVGMIPGWRSTRRLRALSAIGWTNQEMADRIGCYQAEVSALILGKREWTQVARFDAIAAVYEELNMRPGPSKQARERAQAKGYVPPLGYDDIDDPNETPGSRAAVSRGRLLSDDAVRRAHAAFNAGVRTPEVRAGEREYQRLQKRISRQRGAA